MDILLGLFPKLKDLLDRLTAARANNLDKLDTTISSRAPESTALSSNIWTNARASFLNANITSRASQGSVDNISNNVNTIKTNVDAKISSRLSTAVKSRRTYLITPSLSDMKNGGNLIYSTYYDQTIDPIVVGKSVAIMNGGNAIYSLNNELVPNVQLMATLINSTTLRIHCCLPLFSSATFVTSVQVIEYY